MAVYNGNVARAQVVGRIDGQDVINVLHFDEVDATAVGWTPARLDTLIGSIASAYSVYVMPFLSNSYTLERIAAYHLSGPGGVVSEQTIIGVTGGINATPALPNSVALCATIRTARAGRSYRGRTYFSGLAEGQVVANRVTSGVQDVVNLALADALAAMTGDGFRLGVYSTVLAGAPRISGEFTPATSWSLNDDIVDSRRSRLPGRGQ